MNWSDVLADPSLQDLPYKIELDHHGRIVMSPASFRHGRLQSAVIILLSRLFSHGFIVSECSIDTPNGVKVPDVVWASPEFVQRHGEATPLPEAPELCIEIVSPSNRAAEMAEKVQLYLDAGAREVWLVGEDGTVTLHGSEGRRAVSIFPITLPTTIQ